MSEKQQDNVYITGSGRIDGGVYDVIKIMGSARVSGDIEANTVRTAGSAHFAGNVNALNIHTAGACRMSENVSAGSFKTAGSCTVEGDVRATDFACSGSQRIGGDLIAGTVTISGSCHAGNDVEADQFVSKGRFQIGGLLTADEIKIELGVFGGNCRANEIGGERIEVRCGGQFWEWRSEDFERNIGKVGYRLEKGLSKLRERFGIDIEIGDIDTLVEEISKFGEKIKTKIDLGFGEREQALLEVQTLEGDEIYLEYTKAAMVRGKSITLGPGCRIGRVEYSDSLEVDEDAKVDERAKV